MKEQVSTSTTPPLGRELRLIYMSRILTTIRNLLCPWPPPDRWITPFPTIPVVLSRPPLLHYHPTYDLSSSPLPPPTATIHSYTLEFALSFPLFALGWTWALLWTCCVYLLVHCRLNPILVVGYTALPPVLFPVLVVTSHLSPPYPDPHFALPALSALLAVVVCDFIFSSSSFPLVIGYCISYYYSFVYILTLCSLSHSASLSFCLYHSLSNLTLTHLPVIWW